MSKCNCKYAKWFPHNWLCLKGLTIVFLILFYGSAALGLYWVEEIIRNFKYIPQDMLNYLIQSAVSLLFFSFFSLTMAKVLGALRKIKNAVAPCCCGSEKPASVQEEQKPAEETK